MRRHIIISILLHYIMTFSLTLILPIITFIAILYYITIMKPWITLIFSYSISFSFSTESAFSFTTITFIITFIGLLFTPLHYITLIYFITFDYYITLTAIDITHRAEPSFITYLLPHYFHIEPLHFTLLLFHCHYLHYIFIYLHYLFTIYTFTLFILHYYWHWLH